MTFRSAAFLAALAGAALFLSGPLPGADDAAPSKKEIEDAEYWAGRLAEVAEAGKLAEVAKEKNLPEAYIAAARLLRKVNQATEKKFAAFKEAPVDEDGKPIAAKIEADQDLGKLANEWLENARSLALDVKDPKQKQALQVLISAAEKEDFTGTRGAAGGPKRVTRAIEPHKAHVYHYHFVGGLPAAVALQSSGQSQLRFEVLNDGGRNLFNLVCHTAQYNWMPGKGSPRFTFRIVNAGKNPTTYTLLTN